MTVEEMEAAFCEDRKYGLYQSSSSPYKVTGRADLDAFILLNSLLPEQKDIIAAAEHDIIYLSADLSELAGVITQEQVEFLNDCGVGVQDDSLTMFV